MKNKELIEILSLLPEDDQVKVFDIKKFNFSVDNQEEIVRGMYPFKIKTINYNDEDIVALTIDNENY